MNATVAIAALALLTSLAALVVGELRSRSSFRLAWYSEVVHWARDCVRALSAAHEICSSHMDDEAHARARRREVLERLTSLIDEGRFLFENDRSHPKGRDNPYAYQGIRPDILDYLVEAYDLLKAVHIGEASPGACPALVSLKRGFVSDVQKVIQPNWFIRQATITRAKLSYVE